MAWHGVALDLPLLDIDHLKYSVPDCKLFKIFILEQNMKASDTFTTE